MTTKLYGYTVTAPKRLIKALKKTRQDKRSKVNWHNFMLGDMFYTDNDDTYQVSMIDYKEKIICLKHSCQY